MFRLKVCITVFVFSFFLIGTSLIKNQTREIEKKISILGKIINQKEKDFNESQLDFFYLTSPNIIEDKIQHLDKYQYQPMEYSKIFLSMDNFINLENKLVNQKNEKKKKNKKTF